MSLEQAILEAIRALPTDKQQEILSHATRLRNQTTRKNPLRSVKGLWLTSASRFPLKRSKRFSGRCGKTFLEKTSDAFGRGRYSHDCLVCIK